MFRNCSASFISRLAQAAAGKLLQFVCRGLGFRVSGLGFRVQGLGFRV